MTHCEANPAPRGVFFARLAQCYPIGMATKTKRRAVMGRPSKLTQAVLDRTPDLVAAGLTDHALADSLGVHRDTIIGWKAGRPEFAAAYAEGKAIEQAKRDAEIEVLLDEKRKAGIEALQLLRRSMAGDAGDPLTDEQRQDARALLATLPRITHTDITSGGEQLTITPLDVKFVDAAGNEVTVDDEVGV